MIISSQAPTRIDLAGGTLDIWPLYLFHQDSQTVNFAINYYARCRLTPRRDGAIELRSRDLNRNESFASMDALAEALEKERRAKRKLRLPLLARLVMAYRPARGFTLETDAESPAGAGLGGSSALNIAVCGALSRLAGRIHSAPKLIETARNVEAQVLRVPTGEQDYYAAVHGGVQAIRLTPHGVVPEKLAVNRRDLKARVVLCYTGHSRNSGVNNWEVMKAHIDGTRGVAAQFDRIASIAAAMRGALEAGNWNETAKLIDLDWRSRKRNHPGISTDGIEKLMSVARRHGGLAAKVCGAGGGGCVMFLVDPAAKSRVESALHAAGARLLPFEIAGRGLAVRTLNPGRKAAAAK